MCIRDSGCTNERDFDKDDNIPRITWGKYVPADGRETLGMCCLLYTSHPAQEHAGVAGQAFHIAAPAVGVDGVKGKARLARTGQAGHCLLYTSFNNPQGACEKCTGLGTFMRVDEERILPNKNLSIRQGAIKASGWYRCV